MIKTCILQTKQLAKRFKMIQLLTRDNQIIYEVEKSELFNDYRSVLRKAIALKVDLSNLHINSENIDDINWEGVNLKNASFINCSIQNNSFNNCDIQGLSFNVCNLTRLKIRNSTIKDLHANNCNLDSLSIRNSFITNGFIVDCNCKNTLFFQNELNNFNFHTCNISESTFYKCKFIEIRFIHDKSSAEWINNTYLLYCSVVICDMNYVDDISVLYFWETNVHEIDFKREEKFTEIINSNSRVLYAIDNDVVWWKPNLWESNDKLIFRGTLQDFQQEIKNGFPTTDIFPKMDDFEVESELLKVSVFLEQWQRKK